jgi:hypothetical protein
VPLAHLTKRTYVSRVRMYLAWLSAGDQASRRFKGDPLTNPRARDWAMRDYRLYLLRDAEPKRSVRYSNNALAALDDFYVRLGLGKADVARDDLPKTAPKALDGNTQVRWLRAVEAWPRSRDRLLALLPFYGGLRIGDAVALDLADVRMSARKGVLIVYGKGGKIREVPIHPALRVPLTAGSTNGPRGRTPPTRKPCSSPAASATPSPASPRAGTCSPTSRPPCCSPRWHSAGPRTTPVSGSRPAHRAHAQGDRAAPQLPQPAPHEGQQRCAVQPPLLR